VQQVRRGVVGADSVAAIGVDGEMHRVSDRDFAGDDLAMMGMQPAQWLGRAGNLDQQARLGCD
jgi:hypothetical protein